MKKFALAGNPNSGKTTLFNALTGAAAHVGNWPGVTVDKREGVCKKSAETAYIVDLPGIYSLSPYTPEEVIAGNYIKEEKPDCVIDVVDATNIERNLYLTTQLLEADVPVVVALNMSDAAEKRGDRIDEKALEKTLGVPVVKISALKNKGLKELVSRAIEASKSPRKGYSVVPEGMTDEADVADARYRFIAEKCSPAVARGGAEKGKPERTRSDKADRVLTHRVWGIPIFLVVMFLVFHLTFSEDLFFLGAAGVFDAGEETLEVLPEEETEYASGVAEYMAGVSVHTFFGYEEGIYSPGVVLANSLAFVTDLATVAAGDALSSAPAWVGGLLCDGILGGLFAILSFLPQILLLFLFFSLLEDSGYMARVAFILDRVFRKFGLSGRAFMPMIMGFGCSVPAMINTRTLADRNERVATVRVIPFFSCGAKLPILTAIAGAVVQQFGVGNADLITYGMYLLGIVTAIVAVVFMRNTSMRGEVPPFIMELPAYRLPGGKNLLLHLWDKVKHFVKKAFTVILVSTVLVWLISHFAWNWSFLPDENIDRSILAGIGQFLQPLFTPLGFGSQLGSLGWVFAVAAITGLIAKENVIATFGTLAACISAGFAADEALGGVDSVVRMIEATNITVPALIAFIAFNMTTVPCFAAVATARAELPDKKSFGWTLAFWLFVSYVVAAAVYLIGSWWWTSFLFAAALAAAVVLIVLYNKGKLPKFPKRGGKKGGRKKSLFGCDCANCAGCGAEKHTRDRS